ncbi:unnamed protein product, partial [Discosporangium mesarthrocarpum]
MTPERRSTADGHTVSRMGFDGAWGRDRVGEAGGGSRPGVRDQGGGVRLLVTGERVVEPRVLSVCPLTEDMLHQSNQLIRKLGFTGRQEPPGRKAARTSPCSHRPPSPAAATATVSGGGRARGSSTYAAGSGTEAGVEREAGAAGDGAEAEAQQAEHEGSGHGLPLASLSADRVRLGVLTADMSCFKAANPGATLADFVRWYSPPNWMASEEDIMTAPQNPSKDSLKSEDQGADGYDWNAWAAAGRKDNTSRVGDLISSGDERGKSSGAGTGPGARGSEEAKGVTSWGEEVRLEDNEGTPVKREGMGRGAKVGSEQRREDLRRRGSGQEEEGGRTAGT